MVSPDVKATAAYIIRIKKVGTVCVASKLGGRKALTNTAAPK